MDEVMTLQSGFITACLILATGSTAGCAPAPKWNAEAEAKPFLKEMTFADQKSIRVISFDAWDQRCSTLIFTTDKVDFDDPFIRFLCLELHHGGDGVAAIEAISDYRFAKPAVKYSSFKGDFRGNKGAGFQVIKDGDFYVCCVMVRKPKAEDLPATPSKK